MVTELRTAFELGLRIRSNQSDQSYRSGMQANYSLRQVTKCSNHALALMMLPRTFLQNHDEPKKSSRSLEIKTKTEDNIPNRMPSGVLQQS